MVNLMPKLPRPPRLADIFNNNPLHEVIEDAKSSIANFRSEVSSVASSLRLEGAEETETKAEDNVTETSENETKTEELSTEKPEKVTETATSVTDTETLKYQLDHLAKSLRSLEIHLAEGCKIGK
ncbi:MAG: hypothetical protein PHI12_06715 [Dehalococcoidales bacterium]|nr:hypothetical protein [Candidatus Omnitrophota bacterium]MDD5510481.1 hypothetical protein [Dehalococcoidales bacterium]